MNENQATADFISGVFMLGLFASPFVIRLLYTAYFKRYPTQTNDFTCNDGGFLIQWRLVWRLKNRARIFDPDMIELAKRVRLAGDEFISDTKWNLVTLSDDEFRKTYERAKAIAEVVNGKVPEVQAQAFVSDFVIPKPNLTGGIIIGTDD